MRRRGSLTVYALILMVIIGLYVSRQMVVNIDQGLTHRALALEAQARIGADAGLDLALRMAHSSFPLTLASFSITLGTPGMATMTIWYSVTQGNPARSTVSSTAIITDLADREIARRNATNEIWHNPVKRRFRQDWSD